MTTKVSTSLDLIENIIDTWEAEHGPWLEGRNALDAIRSLIEQHADDGPVARCQGCGEFFTVSDLCGWGHCRPVPDKNGYPEPFHCGPITPITQDDGPGSSKGSSQEGLDARLALSRSNEGSNPSPGPSPSSPDQPHPTREEVKDLKAVLDKYRPTYGWTKFFDEVEAVLRRAVELRPAPLPAEIEEAFGCLEGEAIVLDESGRHISAGCVRDAAKTLRRVAEGR